MIVLFTAVLQQAEQPIYMKFVSVTFTKNSQERGGAHPGGGFGGMFRNPWYPAGKPGAQPSGTFSCQQAAN